MLVNNILIFEDDHYKDLYPLTHVRPTYDLVCGMATLLSKIVRLFPHANITLHCREYLKNSTKQAHPGIAVNNVNSGLGCLLINGRLLPTADLEEKLQLDDKNRIFITPQDEVIAAYFTGEHLNKFKNFIEKPISSKEFITTFRYRSEVREIADLPLVQDTSDILARNSAQLVFDFDILKEGGVVKGIVDGQAATIEEHRIYVGKDSVIMPQVVLDARKGPIHIGDNVEVNGPTLIQGPAYIGNHSVITAATLLPGCSIGPGSSVTGQLENVIFHGFTTKLSQEYMGHIYTGEWVHFGVGTIVSPYKTPLNGDMTIGTCTVGDASTTGFCTRISDGTTIGICAQLQGDDYTQVKDIPSFVTGSASRLRELSDEDATNMISERMKLKGVEHTFVEKELLKDAFQHTGAERRRH